MENGREEEKEGKLKVMVVSWLLGNGCLFSWNSMLTIEDYYEVMFPHYHSSRVLTLVYQPFALGTITILAYNHANVNTRIRNMFGFLLFFLGSLAVLVLDFATHGRGGLGPFIGICVVSGAFGVASAHAEGGLVGELSFMCPDFIQSFYAGMAASGALTSALRLITKAAFENSADGLQKGARLFLGISSLYEFFCLLLYAYVFSKLPMVKYYRAKAASQGSKTVTADLAAAGVQSQRYEGAEEDPFHLERLSNKELFVQNMDYAAAMFLIFALSLSIFPGFLSEDTGKHSLGSWYPLVLIAMFNVWDFVGRYIPVVDRLKLKSRKGILIAATARLAFVPAFYFTVKYAHQGWMIMLTSLLGLSNGYLTICVFTQAPNGYRGPEQNAIGNLLVLCLMAGLFAGVALDWLWLIGKGW